MVMRPRRRMRAASTPQEPAQRGGGEQVDAAAEQSIRLAHRALSRFPELVGRHRYVAGGAAVAGALVVLASVAIARRMLRGQTAEEAVEGVTQAEIESLHPRERDDEAPSEPPSDAAQPAPMRSNGASANGYAASASNRGDSQN
ncbi:MAG: hypothetical protein U0360_10290 [Dehalococcoidia bacterium]